MKDFMFIFRGPSYEELQLSPEEVQANMQEWYNWVNQLSAKQVYVGGEPLLPGGKVLQGSKTVVTDGPFAEGKELVGGYFIVKAESLEAATEMAKGFPDFDRNGSVEVREIMKME
ncbi:YciI family protein [Deminuibacter soli]|uniref:YCII-related domain-containing protein n=1 Tax=Deminuibacter soli TaxID=2291815 RepID=A0A3E1NRR5_9BACT|nr:YciI family protein [Deminuibacter soli]RFM30625.1 hypothetical protein DXN05_03935 [Deminuibacter soli]